MEKHYKQLSKLILLVILLFTAATNLSAQNEFITTWKTDNSGTSGSTLITIPTNPTYTYNYNVDWNDDGDFDDADETGFTGDATHDFGTAGSYTIRIQGDFPAIYFNNEGDMLKITDIKQWGNINWKSMYRAFIGCSNLEYTATDNPDLSDVTNMSGMFYSASNFNGDLSGWNTENVTNMSNMFSYASSFNGDLSGWDTGKVTDMSGMFSFINNFNGDLSGWNTENVTDMSNIFYKAYNFDGDLSGWNTGKVTTMANMFAYARGFNGDLSGWDTGKVTDMTGMFIGAYNFNGDLSGWNTENVTSMSGMFKNASSFNQNLSGWNTENVTSMSGMFKNASSFNQNLSGWNIENVTDMTNMFYNAALSTENYDAILKGWAAQAVQSNVTFHAGTDTKYWKSSEARALLVSKGWTITDGGQITTLPRVTINNLITYTSGGVIITNAYLKTEDTDTNDDDLTYTITSALSNGQLEHTDNSGIAISTFTQDDINNNKIIYVIGSNPSSTATFTFSVSDTDNNELTDQVFTILTNSDKIAIITNSGLTLNEGATSIIALEANATDSDNASLEYTITSSPTNGQLERTDALGTAITSFTQADVAAGLICYVHDGTNTTDDSFTFKVSDDTDELTGQTFSITIIPVIDAPTVTTNTITTYTYNTAELGGVVVLDDGGAVTKEGFVYSSIDNMPEIGNDNVTSVFDASSTSPFTQSITELEPLTQYYVRAYATNSGGTGYGAVQTFTTPKVDQTITFAALSTVTYGDAAGVLNATGGASGNPVIFSSSDPSIATCSGTNGTTITYIAAGPCTIYANQAGNEDYNDATQVEQNITINKKTLIITGATASDKVYDGTDNATISGASLAGIIGSDDVTLANQTSGIFATASVGTDVDVTTSMSLTGDDARNYTVTQPFLSADITPAPLTVTADIEQSKNSAEDDPVFIYSITEGALIEGDSFTGILSRASGETAGFYEITLGTLSAGDNYSITFVSSDFEIKLATGLDNTSISEFNFYPNPTKGIIFSETNEGDLKIMNLQGQVIKSVSLKDVEYIDISKQPDGVYLLNINVEGYLYQQKIIKQ